MRIWCHVLQFQLNHPLGGAEKAQFAYISVLLPNGMYNVIYPLYFSWPSHMYFIFFGAMVKSSVAKGDLCSNGLAMSLKLLP